MKFLLIFAVWMSVSHAYARGVLVQCWEKEAEQTTENLVYLNDGGYIYGTMVLYDGQFLDLEHPDANVTSQSSACIDWDLPLRCREKVVFGNNQRVSLQLRQVEQFKDGSQAMIGRLYEVESYKVFCKRSTL